MVASLAYLTRFDPPAIQKYVAHYRALLKESPSDGSLHCAMGICQLELGLYDAAFKSFGTAIENAPEMAEAYYYAAIAACRGRRPKIIGMTEVRKIEENINAAIALDPSNAKFYLLLALVRHEFYALNHLRVPAPSVADLLTQGKSSPTQREEIEKLLRKVPCGDPDFLRQLG